MLIQQALYGLKHFQNLFRLDTKSSYDIKTGPRLAT